MKIIDKYIIKKFLGTFFYAISLLILIVIVFDISENLDSFIKNEAPLKAILVDYYLNFIPYFIKALFYRLNGPACCHQISFGQQSSIFINDSKIRAD